MPEYTKLGTVVILWLLAAFCAAIAWTMPQRLDEPPFVTGFRLLLVLAAIVFAAAGLAGAWDWLRHQRAERVHEYEMAKVAGQRALALAIQGLTPSQTEYVASHAYAEIITIPGIPDPVHALQCVHMKVPMDFVCAFIDASRETAPYLYPEREARELRDTDGDSWRNAVALATALTNQIINMGLAEKAAGPYAALLTVELRDAARAVGVTMGEEREAWHSR